MSPAITYIVSAAYLVCKLVPPDARHLNILNADSGLTVSQSTPQDHPAILPDGYVAYPDIGLAYKVVHANADVDWTEARKRCFDEGAQLAVIDTQQKFDYIRRKLATQSYVHVGIHQLGGEWVSIGNGETLESIPWHSGYPRRPTMYDCLMVHSDLLGLFNSNCKHTTGDYVCELPIPNHRDKNHTHLHKRT